MQVVGRRGEVADVRDAPLFEQRRARWRTNDRHAPAQRGEREPVILAVMLDAGVPGRGAHCTDA
eukprot:11215459-Lingulodinium_polyedra.AAC.1